MKDALTLPAEEDYCTLLGVRADGVAPIVDLAPWTELSQLRRLAERLLADHASCEAVEVWRAGTLLDRIERA
ncbi:hypothetical protein [Phenylobacterium sp.]|uniref:hypothetical protein n=1 Tax=Phenylobacterium sp. TaxID=1871053 RepID=UPI00391911AD